MLADPITLHPLMPHAASLCVCSRLQERRLQLIQSYHETTAELEEARRLNEELRLASQVGDAMHPSSPCKCCHCILLATGMQKPSAGAGGAGGTGMVSAARRLKATDCRLHPWWASLHAIAIVPFGCLHRSWRLWWAAGRAAWPSCRR